MEYEKYDLEGLGNVQLSLSITGPKIDVQSPAELNFHSLLHATDIELLL